MTLRKYKKSKILRATPDLAYIFFRYQANWILNYRNGKKKTFVETIEENIRLVSCILVYIPILNDYICMSKYSYSNISSIYNTNSKYFSDLICAELGLPFLAEEADVEEVRKKEVNALEIIDKAWYEFVTSVPEEALKRVDDMLKAFFFEIDSKLMKMSSDVLGRRRSYRLKVLLTKVRNDKCSFQKDEKLSSNKKISHMEKFREHLKKITGIENFLKKLSILFLFLSTVVYTLLILTWDVKTDLDVIHNLYTITHLGKVNISLTFWDFASAIFDGSSGYNLWRITDLPADADPSDFRNISLINTLVRLYFSSFLLAGILIISSLVLLPTLPTLLFLSNVTRKMRSSEVEKKDNLCAAEVLNRYNVSRSESGVESTLELVMQMSSFLAIAWELSWVSTDHAENLFPRFILWRSFVMSIFSTSLAQYKARMVLHEFTTPSRKKITYFLACLLNSVFAAFVWISLGVAILDCVTFGGFEVSSGGGDVINIADGRKGSKTIYYGIIMSYFLILTILFFSHILRLPTSSVSPDITTMCSEDFQKCFIKQLCFLALLLLWNVTLNIYLLQFAEDTLTPALITQGNTFKNFTLSPDVTFFTPTLLAGQTTRNERTNFILLSTLLMPVCLIKSYVLLIFYFKNSQDPIMVYKRLQVSV